MKNCLLILSIFLFLASWQSTWANEPQCEMSDQDLGVSAISSGCQKDLSTLFNKVSTKSNNNINYKIVTDRNTNYSPKRIHSGFNLHCTIYDREDTCEEGELENYYPYSFLRSGIDIVSNSFSKKTGSGAADSQSEKCACIESNYYIQNIVDNQNGVKDYLENEKRKVGEKALQAYGKKFVNEYSLFYEDMIYFLNQTKVIPSAEEKVTCRGEEQLQKAISAKCPSVKSEDVNERVSLLFSEMPALSGKKGLGEVLHFLDTNTIHRSAVDASGKEVIYSRTDFDKTRHGLSQSPEFKFLDSVLSGLFFDDPEFHKRFSSSSENGLEGISKYLSEKLSENFDGMIIKFSRNGRPPQNMLDGLMNLKNQGLSQKDLEAKIKGHFLDSLSIHPGLSAVMLNNDAFKRALAATKAKAGKSFIDEMQTNFTFLQDHMQERCDEMVNSFAQVVCLPLDEVLATVPKPVISGLVGDRAKVSRIEDTKDLIECAAGSKEIAAFENLSIDGKGVVNSDLLGFLQNPNGENQDSFSSFANSLAKNEKETALIATAAKISNSRTGSSVKYDPLSRYSQSFENRQMINSVGKKSLVSFRDGPTSIRASERRDFTGEPTATVTPVGTSQIAKNSPRIGAPMAQNTFVTSAQSKVVTELFNKRDDKKEVESHLSKLENAEIKKLQEFKDSVLAQREKDLIKQLADEKKSLGDLKLQIDKLTSGKNNVISHTQRESGKTSEKITEIQVPVESRAQLRDQYSANETPSAKNVDRAPAQAAAAAAAAFSTGGGALGAAASGQRALVQERPADQVKKTSPIGINLGDENKGMLKNSKEISDKLVDYLKNVDSETFLKFTKEGVVYKYKVVENGIEVEKEMHVSLSDLDSSLISEIIKNSEEKISLLERKYSFESLKMIITEEVTSKQ